MEQRTSFEILADNLVLTAIEAKDEDVLHAIRFFDEIAQRRHISFYQAIGESNIIRREIQN